MEGRGALSTHSDWRRARVMMGGEADGGRTWRLVRCDAMRVAA